MTAVLVGFDMAEALVRLDATMPGLGPVARAAIAEALCAIERGAVAGSARARSGDRP